MVVVNISGTGPRPRKLQVDTSKLEDLQEDLADHESTWNSIMGATKLAAGLIEGASNEKIKEVETRVKAGLSAVSNAVTDSAVAAGSEAGLGDGTFADVVFKGEEFQKQRDALFEGDFKWYEGAAKKATEAAKLSLKNSTKTEWEATAKLAFDNGRLARGIKVELADDDTRSDIVDKLWVGIEGFKADLQTGAGKERAGPMLTETIGRHVTEMIRNPSELVEDPTQLERLLDQWKASGAQDADVDLARRGAVQNFMKHAATPAGQAQMTAVLSDLINPSDVLTTENYGKELEALGIQPEALSSLKNSANGQYIVNMIDGGMPIAEAMNALESHDYFPGAAELAPFINLPQVSLDTPAEALLDVLGKYSSDGVLWISNTEWSRVGHWFSLQTNADAWNRLSQKPTIMTVSEGGVASLWGGTSAGGGGSSSGGSAQVDPAFSSGYYGTGSRSDYDPDAVLHGANLRAALGDALEPLGIDLGKLNPGRRQHLLDQVLNGGLGFTLDLSKNMEETSAALVLGIDQSGLRATKGGGGFYLDPLNVNDLPQEDLLKIFGAQAEDGEVFAAVTTVNGQKTYELRRSGGVRGEASMPLSVPTIGLEKLSKIREQRPAKMMEQRPADEGHSGESYRAIKAHIGAVERLVQPPTPVDPDAPAPTVTPEDPDAPAPTVTPEDKAADLELQEGIEQGKAMFFTDMADIGFASSYMAYGAYKWNKAAENVATRMLGPKGKFMEQAGMSFQSQPPKGLRGADGRFVTSYSGRSQKLLDNIYKVLDVPMGERIKIDEYLSQPSKQKKRFEKELKRLHKKYGEEVIRKAIKKEAWDKGAKVAASRLGRNLKKLTGGAAGLVLLAGDLLAFGLSDEESYKAQDEIFAPFGEGFDKINPYGIFDLGASFDYTPAPDNAGYIGTALHYVGQWGVGMLRHMSTGEGAAGTVRSVFRSATNILGEREVAFGFSVFEAASQQGTAVLNGLANLNRPADHEAAWQASDSNLVNSLGQTAVSIGVLRDYNTLFSAFDGDSRGRFMDAIRGPVTEMRGLEKLSKVVKLDDPQESMILSELIRGSGEFGGDFHEKYMGYNSTFMDTVDPDGDHADELHRMKVNGGVFWSDRAGTGHFNPEAGQLLVGNADMGGVIGFLEVVNRDQDNLRYTRQEVMAARKFLLDRDEIPHGAHRLMNTVQDLMGDKHLSNLDADEILGGWHEFNQLLPGGDPLEFADDWYDHALASNKNMPEGMVEQYADTVKDYLDWARSSPNIKESLPSMDLEGLSNRQKLTIDLMSWISIGAPSAHSGEPQRNKKLSDFFPTTAEDLVTGASFLRATGMYINTVSDAYGYRFELNHDTPEFLIHLRDEGIVPKNQAEWSTEYGLFSSRLPRTVRSRSGDYGKSTREFLAGNLGIDTRGVGRIEHIDPSLTGPDELGKVQENRVRPYSKEEMKVLTEKALRYELAILVDDPTILADLKIPSLPFATRGIGHRTKVGGPDIWMQDEPQEMGMGAFAKPEPKSRGLTGAEVVDALSGRNDIPNWDKHMSAPLNPEQILGDIAQKQFDVNEQMERYRIQRDQGEVSHQWWYLKNERLKRQYGRLEKMVRMVQVHGLYLEQVDRMPSRGIYNASWEHHAKTVEKILREISD